MKRLFASLTCVLLSIRTPAQTYTNLALEGGGIRGIAYAGAYEELESRGVMNNIRRVAGTSVGAVVGSLICVGYSAQELREQMYHLRIQTFNDGRWIFLGGQWRMRKQYGWYRGDALERWIDECLAQKTGFRHLTFRKLHQLAEQNTVFKDLYVTASNISQQRLTVFSWESFPEMEVATAVRGSMSVPLYFRALCLDSTGHKVAAGQGYLFVDGGLVMNYPLTLFDSGSVNEQTLGLKLERPEQIDYFRNSTAIAPYPVTGFRSYVGALYNLTIETLARKTPLEGEMPRTIYISTAGIAPKVRRVRKEEKDLLYQSGSIAARAFF